MLFVPSGHRKADPLGLDRLAIVRRVFGHDWTANIWFFLFPAGVEKELRRPLPISSGSLRSGFGGLVGVAQSLSHVISL